MQVTDEVGIDEARADEDDGRVAQRRADEVLLPSAALLHALVVSLGNHQLAAVAAVAAQVAVQVEDRYGVGRRAMVGGGQCDGFRAVDAQRLLEQVIVVERHHAQVAAPRVTQPRNLTRDRPREERVRTRGGREELVGDPRVAFPAGQRVDDRCGPEVTVAGSLGLPALDRAPVGQAMRPCSRAAWRSSRFTSTSQLGSPASIEAPAPTSTVSRAAALACATRAVIGGSEKARKLTARIVAATATCGPGGRDDARAAASRRMAGARARGGHLPASVTAGTSPQARRPRRRPSGRSGSSGGSPEPELTAD